MGKARLIKRKDALAQEQPQPEPSRSSVSQAPADAITRAIVEYRRGKKQNPRQAFLDLFQQQHSD